MTWSRTTVAPAVAAKLATVDAAVPAFADPPETFNPPAYIVGVTQTVDCNAVAFGVDHVELRVYVAVGPNEYNRLSDLNRAARAPLDADPTCAGTVQHLHVIHVEQNTRRQSVAGADVLTADLILEIRM